MNPWHEKLRHALIGAAIGFIVLYTLFSVWVFSPWNTYNAPQTYNMVLTERWDDSYDYKGSWHQQFKGRWVDQVSSRTIVNHIDSYTMKQMHLGEVVPMVLKPSELGLADEHRFALLVLPGFCLAAWGITLFVAFFTWLICGIPTGDD